MTIGQKPYYLLPKGSIYCPFKNSGSKTIPVVWFLEPESLNGQYMDPLGCIYIYMYISKIW